MVSVPTRISPNPQRSNKPNNHLSQRKQSERAARISALGSAYKGEITSSQRSILDKPIEELVQDVHKQVLDPVDILRAYGKVAIRAQKKTNCLTEILLPEAEAWVENEVNLSGPLAGIPVSLKDSIVVKDFDASVGYSCKTGKPYAQDGAIVKLLKRAGTSFPFTLKFSRELTFRRRNTVCQDESPNHPPLLRILQRCLGPYSESTQLRILSRRLDGR